jgi:hypothetical protein
VSHARLFVAAAALLLAVGTFVVITVGLRSVPEPASQQRTERAPASEPFEEQADGEEPLDDEPLPDDERAPDDVEDEAWPADGDNEEALEAPAGRVM